MIRFLEVLEVDKIVNQLASLEDYEEIYETPREDYVKRENGIIKLSYKIGGKLRTLTLTKRIGIEERAIKDDEGNETGLLVGELIGNQTRHGQHPKRRQRPDSDFPFREALHCVEV